MVKLLLTSGSAGKVLVALLVAALAGCTHRQLTCSTVLTTSTVMEIEYRTVLMNLALMSCQPEAFPSHADLADGVVQVNDRLGFGRAGGFTSFVSGGNYGFGLDQFGPDGQRQVTEQWGADATTDPQRLVDLQDLYRVALGLEPLPPPNAIVYLRSQQANERARSNGDQQEERSRGGRGGKQGKGNQDIGDEGNSRDGSPDSSETLILPAVYLAASGSGPSATSSGGGGSTPSSGGSSGNSSEHRQVPIGILLSDVPPPGWFHLGGKKDVPKDACYVGAHDERYAWVMADGVSALSRFTVTVLSVVKFKPGEAGKSHGLAVTMR